ncbi:ricin-type beta-trefoil lectin domain protein [Streptomyces anulatus]|uniref:ricin-type beta-trefoil lectin domain protein n=1 Tax=Streptomyces anulatus TaxID=1892 RepID=UPI002251B2E9|nr:ricin-type beta-trefoil lectin domain protein [Streptomyces anulatus]MCX4483103.1 ricin-type beta-trefoil lectin domain protein [Streptomyces anulatus]
MTRSSSQQTPASASPESGAESERAAASSTENAALVGPVAPDAPDSAPVHAKSEAAEAEPSATGKPSKAEKPSEAGKGEKAGKPEGGERPEARAPDGGAATPGAAAAPDSETDPSASAAAQSRLPALVRTMTATAIGQPQQEAGPVGRPGRAALAGAAVVGAVLVSVPFLVLAGNNDDGPKQTNAAAAGTVLDGSGPEAPGEFAVTAPETSAPAEDGKGKKDEAKPGKAGNPVPVVPSADGGKEEAKKGDGSKDTAEKADSSEEQPEKESGGGKNQPAKAQPAVTFSGPVSFRSHLSGRCLDVPGHNFNDGQPLFMWDCNGADAQKWRFGSDGTIRARDKCLDVANANFNNGSRIQLAWCNGADAQKFTLNGAHDLVNTAVGKCVDIPNHSKGRGPETYLILFDCTGNDNQKWST